MDKEALLRVIDLLKKHDIEFEITGTTALSLLGIPSSYTPNDIDIKAYELDRAQKAMLEQLELLSGLENPRYDNAECYSFIVNGTKVNIISSHKDIEETPVLVEMLFGMYSIRTFKVQRIKYALRDKMKLRRTKDLKYLVDLFKNLSEL